MSISSPSASSVLANHLDAHVAERLVVERDGVAAAAASSGRPR